ncbi:hypothetical protein HYS48_01875 [Candidatus Woesearchaeota archaeon]|nr:hypothetical protein [Candidatus Woesearchaeota archaeon]
MQQDAYIKIPNSVKTGFGISFSLFGGLLMVTLLTKYETTLFSQYFWYLLLAIACFGIGMALFSEGIK